MELRLTKIASRARINPCTLPTCIEKCESAEQDWERPPVTVKGV